jgi:serine/threonine protein kinase
MLESTIDMAKTCVGTPCYLSPELCTDVPYSSKSDVWAVGCLLYEMCSFRVAFDAQSLAGLFYKIVKAEFQVCQLTVFVHLTLEPFRPHNGRLRNLRRPTPACHLHAYHGPNLLNTCRIFFQLKLQTR